jgi:hypothetical protein
VLSGVLVRAQPSGHGLTRSGGAALAIETGAKFQIGPRQGLNGYALKTEAEKLSDSATIAPSAFA